MPQNILSSVTSKLRKLAPADLSAVDQFIARLQHRGGSDGKKRAPMLEDLAGLLVSESSLEKDWNRPEEDAAWSNL